MRQLKAIIFDVDGTLANTEETHRQAFNIAFRDFDLGYEWSPREYAGLLSISGGRERIYAYLKAHSIELKGDLNLREFALRIHKRKSEIYREKLIAGHIGLRSGVLRLLNEANQQGIRLGIATCTSKFNVETLLQNALGQDALARFDTIVTSDIVPDKKPSPVAYQYALADLGLTPVDCIAIEDTPNGNRSARACGLKTVITTHTFTIDNNFNDASLVLDQLGEPGQPFSIITGNAYGKSYVDVALLKKILLEDNTDQTNIQVTNLAVTAK